jgi:hypothetical protein
MCQIYLKVLNTNAHHLTEPGTCCLCTKKKGRMFYLWFYRAQEKLQHSWSGEREINLGLNRIPSTKVCLITEDFLALKLSANSCLNWPGCHGSIDHGN